MERDAIAAALKNVKLAGFVWPDPEDASDLRLIKNVVEYGCHIISVEKDVVHPEFAYSIGFYLNYLQPEVVCVEMDHSVAGQAINRIATKLKSGERLNCGVPYEGLHDRSPLMFRELRMEDHTEELGYAIWFYLSRSCGLRFPVYQAMWPDKSGRFPTDAECDPTVIRVQTLKRPSNPPGRTGGHPKSL